MTEKQAEQLRQKIKRIKLDLAADKRRWGGFYDDSRGLRYLPPQYYIKLGDFSGGLKYLKWFSKNFPDDGGFPNFLLEWIIILFKTGKIKEAEKKVFETYCRNTYVFDKFFDRPIVPIDKYEWSNIDKPDFANSLKYSSQNPELSDFKEWLSNYLNTDPFKAASQKYVAIYKLLKSEQDIAKRAYLLQQARKLEKEYFEY